MLKRPEKVKTAVADYTGAAAMKVDEYLRTVQLIVLSIGRSLSWEPVDSIPSLS